MLMLWYCSLSLLEHKGQPHDEGFAIVVKPRMHTHAVRGSFKKANHNLYQKSSEIDLFYD